MKDLLKEDQKMMKHIRRNYQYRRRERDEYREYLTETKEVMRRKSKNNHIKKFPESDRLHTPIGPMKYFS